MSSGPHGPIFYVTVKVQYTTLFSCIFVSDIELAYTDILQNRVHVHTENFVANGSQLQKEGTIPNTEPCLLLGDNLPHWWQYNQVIVASLYIDWDE